MQFTKVTNVFYTIGAVLQGIKSISTNSPWATIIPLGYVILLGMLKEFYADYMRWRADQKENSRLYTVIVKGEGDDYDEEEVRCDELKVGDVIKLKDGEVAPADLFILTTKDSRGECFNKTTSLDGETNLKPKLAVK